MFYRFVIVIAFVLAGMSYSNGQIVYESLLTQNHEGVLESPRISPEKSLTHVWTYQETKGVQIKYDLQLFLDKTPYAGFNAQIRDLLITFYIEIEFEKDGETRTLTAVFDKQNKWMRVKFAPHAGCAAPEAAWGRMDGIEHFEQILDFAIRQLDKNVDLSCYF